MTVSLRIPPIALLVIAVVLPCDCGNETKLQVTFSMAVLEKMVREELKFLEELRGYFNYKQLSKKPIIKKFLKTQTDKAVERKKSGFDDMYFKHPNSIFRIVHQFKQDYSGEGSSLGIYYADFKDFLSASKNLMAEDFDGQQASWVILVLQRMYDLKAETIMKGDYLGFKGPPLMPSDVVDIGHLALFDGYLDASLEWLRLGLSLKGQNANQPVQSEGHIKALMGQAFLKINESKIAMDLYTEALQMDPKDKEVDILGRQLQQGVNDTHSFFKTYDEKFQAMKHLCTLEQGLHVADPKSPKNFCRYREAVLPYYRYKEEILSWSPLVFVIYNVVTDREGQAIQDFVKDEMHPATVSNGIISIARIGSRGVVTPEKAKVLKVHLEKRLSLLTGLDVYKRSPSGSMAETLQVVNYGFGGYFLPHVDAPNSTDVRFTNGKDTRMVTCLVYLNDVEKGGATVFPELNISVFPVKNMALMWYNVNPVGEIEQDTWHGGCPVAVGHKWIVTKWIWTPGSIHRQCGMSVNTTNFELEIESKGAYR